MTEREILICTNTDTVWQRFNEHIWNLYLYNMPQKLWSHNLQEEIQYLMRKLKEI